MHLLTQIGQLETSPQDEINIKSLETLNKYLNHLYNYFSHSSKAYRDAKWKSSWFFRKPANEFIEIAILNNFNPVSILIIIIICQTISCGIILMYTASNPLQPYPLERREQREGRWASNFI